MSQHRRTSKLEEEHARRNPPKLVPPIRVMQDGKRIERLDGSNAPIPKGAPLVVREIVDPVPHEDDVNMPPAAVRVVGHDGEIDPRSTMRDEQPEPPAELSLEPAPPQLDDEPAPPSPRRKSADEQRRDAARESFERRTGAWADQGLTRPAKKRRGIDRAPNEHDEFKKAAKERRVDLLGNPRR